jgi:hypothetical protein
MEGGREMTCAEAMREISGADGRVLRRREIRAHLRACEDCRRFRDAIAERRGELAAIAPLPAVASAGILHAVLGGSSAAGGGTIAGAGTAGTVAGKALAGSSLAKSLVAVALIAAGAVAADRSGLIETPIPGGSHGAGAPAPSRAVESTGRNAGPAQNPLPSAGQSGLSRRAAAARARAAINGNRPGTGGRALKGAPGQTPEGGRGQGGAAGNPPHSTGALPAAASHGQTTAESHGGGRSNAHTHRSGPGAGSSQGAAHSHAGAHGTAAHEGGGHSKEHPPQGGRSEPPSNTGQSSASHSPGTPAQHGTGRQIAPDTAPAAPLQPSKSHSNQGGTAEGERPTD